MRFKSLCPSYLLPFLCFSLMCFLPVPVSATSFVPIENGQDFFVSTSSFRDAKGNFVPSHNDNIFGVQTETIALHGDRIDAGDMDNDGDNDILVSRYPNIYLLRNDGSGAYKEELIYDNVSHLRFSTYLRIADFNNDGLNDFIVGDYYLQTGIHVFLQDTQGKFNIVTPGLDLGALHFDGRTMIFGLAAGDVNNDGNVDVVALGNWGAAYNRVYLYLGDGSGKMSPQKELFILSSWKNGIRASADTALALIDFEGDGDLDIALGGSPQPSVPEFYVFTNDGAGTFSIPAGPAFLIAGLRYSFMDGCDFDHDGDGDLIVASGDGAFYYVENLGGAFAEPVVVGYAESNQIGIGATPPGILTKSAEEQLEDLIENIAVTPELTFANANQAKALVNKLTAILDNLNLIDENTTIDDKLAIYDDMLNKLRKDVLPKTDGFYGGKSTNDWVTTQEGQDYLYPKVMSVVDAIQKEVDVLSGA